MVLQRDRPIEVWGYDAAHGDKLEVWLDYQDGEEDRYAREVSWARATVGKDGTWRATLSSPAKAAVGRQLMLKLSRAKARASLQVLDDILLGDVYLFSGQSNVDLPVSYVHQFSPADQEAEERFAEEIGLKGLLRLMIVPARCGLMYQDGHLMNEIERVQECRPCPSPFSTDKAALKSLNSCNMLGGHAGNFSYCNCDSLRWTRPSSVNVRGFSAVAWFFGKALIEEAVVKGVPLGLVRSSWGATNIAVWSGGDALSKCPQEGDPPTSFAPYVKSALWGHMIYPLRGLRLSAVVWVHGARNIGGTLPYMGGKYYSCALRAMIADWRDKLEQANLPFLVVESPVYCNELDYRTWHTWCDDRGSQLRFPDEHLPEMRLAQNDAEALPNVFVVSTMDHGSLKKVMGGAIHSERKPELGRRLVLAAKVAVYGDSDVVWSGPKAEFAWMSDNAEIRICFEMRGGGGLVLNESAVCPSVVLPVYCPGATFELLSKGAWSPATSVSIDGNAVVLGVGPEVGAVERVRYAWADWPVCSILGKSGMPARLFNLPVLADADGLLCPKDSSGAATASGGGSEEKPREKDRHDARAEDRARQKEAEPPSPSTSAAPPSSSSAPRSTSPAPSTTESASTGVVLLKSRMRTAQRDEEPGHAGGGGVGTARSPARGPGLAASGTAPFLSTMLFACPVLAVAGIAAWYYKDKRAVARMLEKLMGLKLYERTPDVPDYLPALTEEPSSGMSSPRAPAKPEAPSSAKGAPLRSRAATPEEQRLFDSSARFSVRSPRTNSRQLQVSVHDQEDVAPLSKIGPSKEPPAAKSKFPNWLRK